MWNDHLLERKLQPIVDRLTALEGKVELIVTQVEKNRVAIEELNVRVTTGFESLDNRMPNMEGKMSNMEGEMSNMKDQMSNINSLLSQILEKVTRQPQESPITSQTPAMFK